MNAALLGYGTVGRSLDELLSERPIGIPITRILRRPGKTAGDLRMTDDIHAILADPTIDVVVEALSGEMPAARWIEAALAAGKHVVTANKAAIAPRMAHLTALARGKGAAFRFEASVGGVVPWIENLRRAAGFDRIDRFCGILNGTGNYILDRMAAGLDFDEALALAQAKGYAEADPSADVGGLDLANKALVTAAAAFGLAPEPGGSAALSVPTIGLDGIDSAYLKAAAAAGKTVRFMAFGRRSEGKSAPRLALGAAPVLVPLESLEAAVRRNYNFALFWGDVSGPLAFFGQGAGGRPTADAILSDLRAIAESVASAAPRVTEASLDDALLFGHARYADGTVRSGAFADLAREAKALRGRHGFAAFEPAPALFER